MRDFRDAKAMAQTLRAALAAKGLKISIGESLELIAKAFGAPDWNTLSAAIKASEAAPAPAVPIDDNRALDGLARALGLEDWDKLRATIEAARLPAHPAQSLAPDAPPKSLPRSRGGTSFSGALEATLHRALALANTRKHAHATVEHLLLALIADADAAEVMRACEVDLSELAARLTLHIDNELKSLVVDNGEAATPTAGFHRVIQRAVIHVQSSGRDDVTGANVLVAIFSERESHAAHFLRERNMERYDAVNFIAHGVRKDGGRAA